MNLSRTLASLLLVVSTTSFAGNVRGNGGGVVVCRDSQGKILTAEILDFYEARELRHMQHDFGPANSTYMEKVKYVLERRRDVAPVRTMMWGQWADSFETEATRLSNVELELINDSLIPAWPAGCKVEQIVIQKEPSFPEDRRYIVNQDLWNVLDEENRAGLILHEVIYREAISYGHENSVATRYINSVWSSPGTPSYLASQQDLNDLFKQAQFLVGEWLGTAPALYKCSISSSGKIRFYNSPVEAFEAGKLYHTYYRTDNILMQTKGGRFSVRLDMDRRNVCHSEDIAAFLNEDGTLKVLDVWNSVYDDVFNFIGEVTIQNTVLRYYRIIYRQEPQNPGPLTLQTNSKFKRLEGINGKWYSSEPEETKYPILWFNDDLKVVACEYCVEE